MLAAQIRSVSPGLMLPRHPNDQRACYMNLETITTMGNDARVSLPKLAV